VFPVFLALKDRRVLLVGGGPVAAGKLRALLDAGAQVVVVAPEIHPDIAASPVTVFTRPFESADLDGCWYVVAAAPHEVNAQVARQATARGIFVNAVDDVDNATAYAGAILRRGGVTIAVSTDGEAPALAGLVREALEELLPVEIGGWMTVAREARRRWLAEGVAMDQRRPLLLEALVTLYERRGAGLTGEQRGTL